MQDEQLELDGVVYRFQAINASKAWQLITSALSTLTAGDLAKIDGSSEGELKQNGLAMLGAVLSKINTSEFKQVQSEVWKHTTASKAGKTYRLDETMFDSHFNEHRTHLVKVLFAGVKFQFTPFLPVGGLSLADMQA